MATVRSNIHVDVAKMIANESNVLDEAAADIERKLVATASQHRATGDYIASIQVVKVGRRIKDRFVVVTDPGALAIEFGHYAGGESDDADAVPRTWVPGQHIVGRTFRAL